MKFDVAQVVRSHPMYRKKNITFFLDHNRESAENKTRTLCNFCGPANGQVKPMSRWSLNLQFSENQRVLWFWGFLVAIRRSEPKVVYHINYSSRIISSNTMIFGKFHRMIEFNKLLQISTTYPFSWIWIMDYISPARLPLITAIKSFSK